MTEKEIKHSPQQNKEKKDIKLDRIREKTKERERDGENDRVFERQGRRGKVGGLEKNG